jgi:Mn-containing catalase
LREEGDEVMAEGQTKEDAPADLALIGAAEGVEHYEIAAYRPPEILRFTSVIPL